MESMRINYGKILTLGETSMVRRVFYEESYYLCFLAISIVFVTKEAVINILLL